MNLHCIPLEFVGCGEWVEPWGTLHQEEEGNLGTGEGAASAKREARDAQMLTCSRPDSQTLA